MPTLCNDDASVWSARSKAPRVPERNQLPDRQRMHVHYDNALRASLGEKFLFGNRVV